MKYYLLLNSDIKGPFPLGMVREMLAAGAIQDTTLIAPEGGRDWSPVRTFLESLPTGAGAIHGAAVGEESTNPVTFRNCYGNRKVQVAAVLLIGIGFWATRSSRHPSTSEGRTRISNNQPDTQYRPSYNGRSNTVRSEIRQILERRYPEDASLRNEIERGVFSLQEVYPDSSAWELVRKFESMATGY